MADQTKEDIHTLSIQIANQIINIANARLEDGMKDDVVAQGLRHAAANFSAFSHHRNQGTDDDLGPVVEDFIRTFEYYLQRHAAPAEQPSPGAGLTALIDQAKNEI